MRTPEDVWVVRRAARMMAGKVGLDDRGAEELAIAVSELASNLVRHAEDGTVTLSAVERGVRMGVRVDTVDSGPGIPDVELAMTDGFSTLQSTGTGLGAANRLMDEFSISSSRLDRLGTSITCTKWRSSKSNAVIEYAPVCVGTASRARLGSSVNGDAFLVVHGDSTTLVGVLDGVGHGIPAREASYAARHFIENHADLPLRELILGADRACRATRGAVIGLGLLDWSNSSLSVAGIGNIDVRLLQGDKIRHVIMRRGVVGKHAPRARVETLQWTDHSRLVLNSDGISARWRPAELSRVLSLPAAEAAQELLTRYGKEVDDATVLVMKGRLA